MSSLNKALVWVSRYSCSSLSLPSSTNTLSHYSSTCPKYMGNMSMSPTWKICLVVPLKVSICLGSSLCHSHYSNIFTLYLFILIPIIFISEIILHTYSLIQSTNYSGDLLKDSFPSSLQNGFQIVPPAKEDLEFQI